VPVLVVLRPLEDTPESRPHDRSKILKTERIISCSTDRYLFRALWVTFSNSDLRSRFVSSAERRLSMEQTAGLVLAKRNIFKKKGKFNFKIIGIE
jgi:hypothetical protein